MSADDVLPELFSEATTAPAGRAGCADSATLAALAAGELDGKTRERWLDHVALCADCAIELRLAKEIHGWVDDRRDAAAGVAGASVAGLEAAQTEPGGDAPPEPLPFRPPSRIPAAGAGRGSVRRWLPLAASALLALSLGWWWMGLEESVREPMLRGAGAGERSPGSGTVLEGAPSRFAWPARAGAEAYRVELSDGSGNRLWQSHWLEQTEVDLPADLLRQLGEGTYLWTVEARGQVRERISGPHPFRIEAGRAHGGA
ncbi:MAG: hypothetical protein MI919_43200 [Holophagales bacterium]|nr:hypothetical protein [Holophagales bacterium]